MSLADVSLEYAFVPPEDRQRCVEVAIEAVKSNHSLRAPRNAEDRENAFAGWIAQWHSKLEPTIYAALRREMTILFKNTSDDVLAQVVEQYVWTEVAGFLRVYGVKYQAGMWGRKHFGDATIYHDPQPIGNTWHVPIGVLGHSEKLGQITLDEDGNVIESLTSTRQQLLDKIRDNQPSSSAAGSRQQ